MPFALVVDQLIQYTALLASAVICVAAVRVYREIPRRGVLLIAVASASGVVRRLFPFFFAGELNWTVYYTYSALQFVDLLLWVAGILMLFLHYSALARAGMKAATNPVTPPLPGSTRLGEVDR